MPLLGPPDVEKLKAKRDVKGLIKALGYEKASTVRMAAARVLGEIGDARAVKPLTGALGDTNYKVRETAAYALAQISAPAVGSLITALGDRDRDVRQVAAHVLTQIGPPAVEPLIAALEDDDWNVRWAAIEALGRIGDARSVGPLITVLGNLPSHQRETAAEALGRIGDARAVEPLIAALKDVDVRQAAAGALDDIGWQPGQDADGAVYWIAKAQWDKCVAIGAPAVQPLTAVLKDKDDEVRWAAAKALLQIGDTRAVGPLIAALQDSDCSVREAAVDALGQIGGARAIEHLVAALKDEDGDVRQAAAHALAQIGAPAVEPLIALYKKTDFRVPAVKALGQIGGTRAVEFLVAALKDKDIDVRRAATEALGRIGTPATEPLLAALKDVDVRQAAAGALDDIGWQPDQDVDGAVYWIAKARWDKCIAIGAPAVQPLTAALEDKGHQVRQAAAKALLQIGDAQAVEPLIAALQDSDRGVREAAVDALGQIGDARAVESLVYILKDKDAWMRKQAANALYMLMDARAVEPLAAALHDRDQGVREAAAEALGPIGDTRAVVPLITALKDRDGKVRLAAARALDELGWQPDNGEAAAAYWVVHEQWDKCVGIGAPAVEPLITVLLRDVGWTARRDAAAALVKVYETATLTTDQRQRILEQRHTIQRTHEDHMDIDLCYRHPHEDHNDVGIGVEFPL
jgi:HEAT repeat protein